MEIYLNKNDFIFSKTDQKGRIIYCNNQFEKISQFSRKELLGKPHNILRHADMPKIAFKILWDKLKNGKEFYGFIKNKTKNGDFYWVYTYIAPDIDLKRNLVGYSSIRRQINRDVLSIIEPIYNELKLSNHNLFEANKKLNEVLKKYKLTYNELIINLQEGVLL